MTNLHLWDDQMSLITLPMPTHTCVPWHYSKAHMRDTGWSRPIGCLKLQVMFLKRATKHRALLRKINFKDEASYGSSPPCTLLHIRDVMLPNNANVCDVVEYAWHDLANQRKINVTRRCLIYVTRLWQTTQTRDMILAWSGEVGGWGRVPFSRI